MSYLETGQVQKAEEPLETVLRANPKDALVQITLAKVRITSVKDVGGCRSVEGLYQTESA
jgi:Tfp pilus assembly protein PilF